MPQATYDAAPGFCKMAAHRRYGCKPLRVHKVDVFVALPMLPHSLRITEFVQGKLC